MVLPDGRIEKGEHLSPSTEFKKGISPHNKGKRYTLKLPPDPRVCKSCGELKPASDYPLPHSWRCTLCYKKHQRRYRDEHKDLDGSRWRKSFEKPQTKNNHNAWGRRNRQKLRLQIIMHYSPEGICQNCGCNDIRILSIDHINGGGCKHRKSLGGGSKAFYNWIIKNNFPPGFQILCPNCQTRKKWEKGENCGKQPEKEGTPLKKRKNAEYARRKRQEKRKIVIQHYSPDLACQKCGESDFRVLTLDHIHGGGKEHLRSIKANKLGGAGIYKWTIKNNFPKIFQVLCCNCQWIKRYYNNEIKIREDHA